MPPLAPACDVVIVNFRTPDLVVDCVRSIRDHAVVPDHRVIVVENGSGDDSAVRLRAALPDVQLIVATGNGGFGAGVNLGMAAATGDAVLVLNPDTRFVDRSFSRALSLLRNDPTIGIVGLDLRNPDGTRQFSARRFYTMLDIVVRRTPLGRWALFDRVQARHLMTLRWQEASVAADWVMGTGFLVRRAALEAVGGMDEDFFLYMEDVDLCRRLGLAQWRVVAASGAVLVHDHQRASASGPFSWSGRQHLRSLWRYIRKHGTPPVWPRQG